MRSPTATAPGSRSSSSGPSARAPRTSSACPRRRATLPRPLGDQAVDAGQQRSTSATISSSPSPAALAELVLIAGQRRADRLRLLQPGRRLLGRVANSGRVDLEVGSAPSRPGRARAVGEAQGERVGLLAVDRDDQLVALVLRQLLAAGRHLVLAGDDQDREDARRAPPSPALSSVQASFLESRLSLASKTIVASGDPARRRSRPACRPSCPRLGPTSPVWWRRRRGRRRSARSSSWTSSSKLRPLRVPAARPRRPLVLRLASAASSLSSAPRAAAPAIRCGSRLDLVCGGAPRP